MRITRIVSYVFIALFCVSAVIGQETQDAVIKQSPKPEIPKEARESGLGGRVTVRVNVDKTGKVTSAEIMTAPDWVCPSVTKPDVVALRNVAKAAALRTAFSPAIAEGKPVDSVMAINFDFPNTITPKTPGVLTAVGNNESDTGYRMAGKDDPDAVKGAGRIIPNADAPKIIGGAVLNGRATSLPKPTYPPAARAVRAGGAVNIQVLIETDGSVFSATPVAGHPLLRSSARTAACGSRFSPTLLSGEPVMVAGIITYNFVP